MIIFNLMIIILLMTVDFHSEGFVFESELVTCEDKRICSECIQTKGCAWCSRVKPNIFAKTSRISKCHTSENIEEICEKKFVENPKSVSHVEVNLEMRNGLYGESIQIRPQEIYLKLKPEEEFTIDIQFKKAENYPVDLYYLMDFSSSMSKYKNNLSKLGNKLAETMKNLTINFQLGFGSFVDKVTLPYTSTVQSHLLRPCPKCGPPYSFKNHMSLTRETTKFSKEVQKAQMSGNIDTPEGVLDALMQVMVCHEQLNWREKARHIIVVSTDAPFHLAGDGKLGGVVEPHDGKCYVNSDGDYTHSLKYDYPSVSQISHKALENNMNIIFAVVNKVKNEYLSLSKEIRGASLGLLDGSVNIAELIKAQYEKITTTVRLTDNSRSPVRITYSSRCSRNDKWESSNECTGVKGGSVIQFKTNISVSGCSAGSNNQKIIIKPVGINESLTVNLETICDCECSSDENHPANELKSKYCSFSGDFICGQCVCQDDKIGESCECNGNDKQILNLNDTKSCMANNLTNEICSGRGECKCGLCQCHPRKDPKEEVTGRFCECDNFSCERSNGLLCSGHGTCKCGKCVCDPQWSGDACDCFTDPSACKAENQKICSDKGTCICGVCHCHNGTDMDENRYSGKYCQFCMTCYEQCDMYNDCVECLSYRTGPLAETQCSQCSQIFQYNMIESIEDTEIYESESSHICVSADHSGCTFKYIYYYDKNDKLLIWAETNTLCPKEVNVIGIVAGTIGSTVLVGLLSLIAWRILVDIHDMQEYQKFEKERHLASWARGDNPLFKTATKTYQNPTYVTDAC